LGLVVALQGGLESRLMTRLGGLTEYVSGDQGADSSAETRVRFMTAALSYWSDSISTMIFGNGLFSYSTQLRGSYFIGAHPHNLVLLLLTELGLLGLVIYSCFIGSLVLGKGIRLIPNSPLSGILLGIAVGELFRAMIGTQLES